MSPRALSIIFLSPELHCWTIWDQAQQFFISNKVLKICVTKSYIFFTKRHFGPLWASPKLIFTNFRYFFKKTIEKYNEVEYENIFKLLIILKNKKVIVTWRWPLNFVSQIFLLYKKYLKSLTGCGMTICWDFELGSMCSWEQIYSTLHMSFQKNSLS